MEGAINQIAAWRKDLGIVMEQYWVHCNAHIEPALASSLDKALLEIEGTIGLRKIAVEALNAGFFGANSSCVITMVYALMHMLGPSKLNQEWSQTKNFEMFLTTVNEKRNHLQDAKCSRFGKYPEFLVLVCYHFKNIQIFLDQMYETNKMFVSCRRYINAPFMREIALGVAVLYHHIIRPFLVAVGTESIEGFKQLTHLQLCSFYPAIINELSEISSGEGVDKVLQPAALSYLDSYPTLVSISHKGHKGIFESLFKDVQEDEDLQLPFVRKVICIVAESYAGEFRRQTEKFYLGEGVVKKLLDEDSAFLDGVPTNALAAEHQVAEARYSIKRAPTTSMSAIGQMQIIAKSPYMDLLREGKLTRDNLRAMLKASRRDPRVKLAKKLLELDQDAVKAHTVQQVESSKAKKIAAVKKRRESIDRCREHGGPVTTKEELKALLSRCKGEEAKTSLLRAEIFYQKYVIYQGHIVPDKSIFVCSRKNDLGKQPPKPVTELRENLEQLLNPVFLESSDSIVAVPPLEDLCKLLDDSRNKLHVSNEVKKMNRGVRSFEEGDWVATYWQEEDSRNNWYVGKVSAVVKPGQCRECVASGLASLNESAMDPCYEVVYLSERKTKAGGYSFEDVNPYHTLSCQMLCKVELAPQSRTIFKLLSPSFSVIDKFVECNSVCKVLS